MKCLDDCHVYEMDTFMGSGTMQGVKACHNCGTDIPSVIGFYRMNPDGTKVDGVTNEDVIKVLIHRIKFLNNEWMDGKFKCQENLLAILHLEAALIYLEQRTLDRIRHKVEGTQES